jgi:glycosyltransferase involved in cell wall biosynthesis
MRVLAVTHHPDRAESELFVLLHQSGVEIEVMCHGEAKWLSVLQQAGVPITLFDGRGRFNKRAIAAIRERIGVTRADILYMLNSHAVTNGLQAARGLDVKTVAYRGVVGGLSWLDPAAWLTYFHPRLDRVVCVAEAIKKWFLRHRILSLFPPKERFVAIHKGHRIEWYEPARREELSRFNIPADAFAVALVANYRKGKGIETLIDAASLLPEDIHILLIGQMDGLKNHLNQSPAKHRIHLTGFQENSPALAGACDLYVLCSYKKEGLPKTVIEAMAQAVPAIVADAGGSPELIVHEESGCVVPPRNAKALAEAITHLKNQPEKRAKMGHAAKARIQTHFTPEQTLRESLELFRELVPQERG